MVLITVIRMKGNFDFSQVLHSFFCYLDTSFIILVYIYITFFYYLCHHSFKNESDMDNDEKLKIEERIVDMLKTVYDPEIPVNVYDLGLIYKIDLQENGDVSIDMTLTAPNCPAADFIMEDIRQKIESVEGVNSAQVNLVFEPEWDKDMMSEEAKLELGFL